MKTKLPLILAITSLVLNFVLIIHLFTQNSTFSNSLAEISAKQIAIVDETGTTQILLTADSLKGAMLQMGDSNSEQITFQTAPEKTRISINGTNDSVAKFEIESQPKIMTKMNLGFENQNVFSLNSAPLKTEMKLTNIADGKKIIIGSARGNSGMMITDENNVARVGVYYNNDHANFMLFDKRGVQRTALSLLGSKPQLGLFDSLKRPRLSLMLHNNNPSFEYYDDKGKIRYKLMESNNDPIMAFMDNSATPLVTMGLTNSKPEILVQGDKQNVIWKSP